MTETALAPVRDAREGRDRFEIMTALVNSPSFDPVFRSEIVEVPPDHPVYRWICLVTDCERRNISTDSSLNTNARGKTPTTQ